jgi:uncharacterized protein (DUF885 family)
MMTLLRLVAIVATIAVSACSSEPPPPKGESPDVKLQNALKTYVVEFLRRNPTTNTYLGGAGLDASLRDVDGTLRDYSRTALEDEDRWLTETSAAVSAIPPDGLSTGPRIDREVALAQIRFMLRQHQIRRYQERALDTYVGEPFRALDWQLQGMTQTGASTYGTSDEWMLVVNRVRAIPRFLATAEAQLEIGRSAGRVPDRRMLERDGLNTTEANAKYFGETLVTLAAARASGPEKDRILAELADAAKLAADSYLAFRQFVAQTFFERVTPPKIKAEFADDRFAMGEEEYNWATKNNFRIDTSAATLFDEAWPVVQATQAEMTALAQTIGRQHGWKLPVEGGAAVRAVFDELSKDFPKSDEEMIAWYRDTAARLVKYGRTSGVFDVPADYKLDVTVTPPPLEASIDGAAYYAAPPFKNTGVGRFYVTPTHNDRAALASNNRASLADLAAHEGFPGHDWHFKVMTAARDRISPVRWLTPGAVEDSSSMWEDSMPAEGWGLYAEALMAEPQPGSPAGFYSPEERLYQLQGKLYRDLRVHIDTGIHTGRMAYDEAVNLYSEVVDFLPGSCTGRAASTANAKDAAKRASCASAERAIFRYSKWPTQAITYRLGKDQIYAMRAEAAKILGDRFSAKAFHLRFMQEGTIPAGYFRESLLEDLTRAK